MKIEYLNYGRFCTCNTRGTLSAIGTQLTTNNVEDIKPPIRISKQAAADLANNRIFKKYEFKMRSSDL